MNVEWMRGCATALVTPFKADGGVDLERMRALVGRQVVGGVKLLVPCGTTGESVTMTAEERERVIAAAVEVGAGARARHRRDGEQQHGARRRAKRPRGRTRR